MLDHDIPRELTPPGKGLDLTFLGKPHEHDPRRVYSTTGRTGRRAWTSTGCARTACSARG